MKINLKETTNKFSFKVFLSGMFLMACLFISVAGYTPISTFIYSLNGLGTNTLLINPSLNGTVTANISGSIVPTEIYNIDIVTSTNGFGSLAVGTYLMTLNGYTNTTQKSQQVWGFTGTSVTYTDYNPSGATAVSLGTISTPINIILKPNAALIGTSCGASLIEDF